MGDLLFFIIGGLLIYIMTRIILKEPLLPWKEKKIKVKDLQINDKKKGAKEEEDDSIPFESFFPEVKKIEDNMIHQHNHQFSIMCSVSPVNYFLRDQSEQEAIDSIFETWLSQLDYNTRVYLQNRFIDLTEPIEEIKRVMDEQDDLPALAIEYGEGLIEDLLMWQRSQPRYETHRFIVFDVKIEPNDIKAKDEAELEEKIIDKAFNELYRRMSTAKNQLRKAEIEVSLLSTDGINEVAYYQFNRRKALKNRYRDIARQEQHAIYTTADQSPEQIVMTKGAIDDAKQTQTEEETKAIS